jgi:hypothetical protein
VTVAISSADTGPSLQILTKKEYEILKAVSGRIVPGAFEEYGLDLATKIDSVFANLPQHFGHEFKLLLRIFEYGTPFLGLTFKRFTQMTPEEQDHYLAGWECSRLPFKRMGFQALKRTALSAFYGSERTWALIGYRGPWLERGYPPDFSGKGIQHFAKRD